MITFIHSYTYHALAEFSKSLLICIFLLTYYPVLQSCVILSPIECQPQAQSVYSFNFPTEFSLMEEFFFSLPVQFIIWMEFGSLLSLFLMRCYFGRLLYSSLFLVRMGDPQQYYYFNFGNLWAPIWECAFIFHVKIFISSIGIYWHFPRKFYFFPQEIIISVPSHNGKWKVSLFEQPVLPQ